MRSIQALETNMVYASTNLFWFDINVYMDVKLFYWKYLCWYKRSEVCCSCKSVNHVKYTAFFWHGFCLVWSLCVAKIKEDLVVMLSGQVRFTAFILNFHSLNTCTCSIQSINWKEKKYSKNPRLYKTGIKEPCGHVYVSRVYDVLYAINTVS